MIKIIFAFILLSALVIMFNYGAHLNDPYD